MRKKIKMSTWRLVTGLGLIGLIIFCTTQKVPLGTFCAMCPIGLVETSLASRSVTMGMVLPVIGFIVLVAILGRWFCSWLCPTAVVRAMFFKKEEQQERSVCSGRCGLSGNNTKEQSYVGYVALAVICLVSFLVKFPLFCLFCPLGICFGIIFALNRLFVFYDPSWDLVILPALLFLEIIWFKSWCKTICPLGAIFRLIHSVISPIFQPKVTRNCLQEQGIGCQTCQRVCPEQISVVKGTKKEMANCTLCLECKVNCPQQAIHLIGERKQVNEENHSMDG